MKKWLSLLLCAALPVIGLFHDDTDAPPPEPTPAAPLTGVALVDCIVTPYTLEVGGQEQFGIHYEIRYQIAPDHTLPVGSEMAIGIEFSEELTDIFGTNGTAYSIHTVRQASGATATTHPSFGGIFTPAWPEEGTDHPAFQPMNFTVNCCCDGELVFSQDVAVYLSE